MSFSALNFSSSHRSFLTIPLIWVGLGLVYGLQHYVAYFMAGYSCNFAGTTFGQMSNFLIWGFVALFAFQFEKGALKLNGARFNRDLQFLRTVAIVFCLHLTLLFTTNWIVYGGTLQAAVVDYQDRYVFGWFYFQLLVYSIIISYYAPSIRRRLLDKVASFRKKKHLAYFEFTNNGHSKQIRLEDVESINANDYYIELFDSEKKYLIRQSLKDVEKRIDPRCFLRIHRSTLVNLKKVKQVFFSKNQWYVETMSGCTYPVGRSRKDKVLTHLEAFKGKRSNGR